MEYESGLSVKTFVQMVVVASAMLVLMTAILTIVLSITGIITI